MATYYAWSNFPIKRNEWGQPTEVVKVGDTVSASKLGISDEEFEELIAVGAVSEEEYPDIPADVSPAEYEQQQNSQQAVVDELQARIDQQKEQAKADAKAQATPAQPKATPAASKE